MATEWVVLRQHGQGAYRVDRPIPEAFIMCDERQMNVAAAKAVRQTNSALFHEVHFNARMMPPVGPQEDRQRALDRLRRGAHAQDAGLSISERARAFADGIGILQEASAKPQKILAFRGQLHAAANAVEQR